MNARTVLVCAGLCANLCVTAGCAAKQEYVGTGTYAFAMTEETPPFFEADTAALFEIDTRITLPIVPPTEAEMAALGGSAPAPFARMPWLGRNDLNVQIEYTVSNLEDEAVQIAIVLNGVNEFNEYVPAATIIEEEPVADYAQIERVLNLAAGQRYNGTIRQEELDEVAVDLATVVNGAPNANQIVYFENQSASDPRSQPYIPSVIPGLVAFRLGIRASGEVAPRIVVEATVRVRSDSPKFATDDVVPWVPPAPALFTPAPATDT
ncbi:MAG: hypothetical protein IPK60_11355 [Sandaracinaceae bacterium]|nr:hypothetical protein [Sandaracinaceae bacterium]